MNSRIISLVVLLAMLASAVFAVDFKIVKIESWSTKQYKISAELVSATPLTDPWAVKVTFPNPTHTILPVGSRYHAVFSGLDFKSEDTTAGTAILVPREFDRNLAAGTTVAFEYVVAYSSDLESDKFIRDNTKFQVF